MHIEPVTRDERLHKTDTSGILISLTHHETVLDKFVFPVASAGVVLPTQPQLLRYI